MAKKTTLPLGTKAAFVRANPKATVQELIKLAKKQRIPLTAGHVYNIRAQDKEKGTPSAATQPLPSPASDPGSSTKASSQLDAQLRTLVIRIGLDRAEQVFSELKSTLSRMT